MQFFKNQSTSAEQAEDAGTLRGSLGFEEINLRMLNRLLMLAVVFSVAFAILFYIRVQQRSLVPPLSDSTSQSSAKMQVTTKFEAERFYLDAVGVRNIFRLRAQERDIARAVVPVPSSRDEILARLQTLKANLNVVGVSWREPGKVMLYDKRKRSVFFLRKGETIGDTGASVRTISRDEIVIGIEDEEISL